MIAGCVRRFDSPTAIAPSLVRARVGEGADDLVHTLGLEARKGNPVILVCGGADELRAEPMAVAQELLGPAVISAAELTGAAVVDGGTASGVMTLTGAARSNRRPPCRS